MSPAISHILTENVGSVFVAGGGQPHSGLNTPLFDENFASLWGAGNVLTILDLGIFTDTEDSGPWETADNSVFAGNVVDWLAIPEPSTGLLFVLSLLFCVFKGRSGRTGASLIDE